jgi:hypothetical protein
MRPRRRARVTDSRVLAKGYTMEPPFRDNVHLNDAVGKVEDFLLDLPLRIEDRGSIADFQPAKEGYK